jgi:transcriptional regulator
MYHVPYFKALEQKDVLAFMQSHPFVTICGVTDEGWPVATQVPVLVNNNEEDIVITGHLMRKQMHTQAFEKKNKVFIIFQGEHSYVSASWYTQPLQASTWNYMAVHATCYKRMLDEAALHNVLLQQTRFFKGKADSINDVVKIPDDYLEANMKVIVAFVVRIAAYEHVFKLSQNKDDASFHSVVQHLQNRTPQQQQLSKEMMDQNRNRLYENK